jgi:predicted branched-subunit amino acid permease
MPGGFKNFTRIILLLSRMLYYGMSILLLGRSRRKVREFDIILGLVDDVWMAGMV